MTTMLQSIGTWVGQLHPAQVPEPVFRAAKRSILDLFGVTVAGSTHRVAECAYAYLSASGHIDSDDAGLIGRRKRTDIEGATLFNAAIGHILDFDDSSDTLGGHPTVVIVPALLALGEARGSSGRDLLLAYIAGVEVAAHIGRQMNQAHYERGWHPTATLGPFGVAAACCKLMGLDTEATANALSIVSAMPSGVRASFGTDMKAIQVGEASRRGLTAALLGAADIGANPLAFEDSQGFGEVYNGSDGFGRDLFDGSPGRKWEHIDPGLTIKVYPCCASAHPAVDAAIRLRRSIPRDSIDQVRIKLHARRLRHTNRPNPSTSLDAKFSVQYAVAVALLNGTVTLDDFADGAHQRSEVQELLSRISAVPFGPEEAGPDHYAGEVEVHLDDGSSHSIRVDRARGRGTEVALSDEEVEEKFRSCVVPALGAEGADRLANAVLAIEDLEEVSDLIGLTIATGLEV